MNNEQILSPAVIHWLFFLQKCIHVIYLPRSSPCYFWSQRQIDVLMNLLHRLWRLSQNTDRRKSKSWWLLCFISQSPVHFCFDISSHWVCFFFFLYFTLPLHIFCILNIISSLVHWFYYLSRHVVHRGLVAIVCCNWEVRQLHETHSSNVSKKLQEWQEDKSYLLQLRSAIATWNASIKCV